MNFSTKELIELIGKKDRRALAKAITIVENRQDGMIDILNYCYRNMNSNALIVGITGPGGAGKSTTIDKVIKYYREKGKKVAVIAVDPSSPYTGGAFLGDRIRMSTHNVDKDVFIRSFASRGCMGGISEGTKNILYLFKNYDFDVIIVESLGIGQDETEITNFVDVTVVTVVPGFGDAIQIAKAGMQEIADIFVINKADKPDAEEFYNQMRESLLSLPEDIRPKLIKTIATDNIGIEELACAIEDRFKENACQKDQKDKNRVRIEVESYVNSLFGHKIDSLLSSKMNLVFNHNRTPFEVGDEIIKMIKIAGD